MIRFGPWSTALAFGALFGLVVALALGRTRDNATANLLLAALLIVIVLKLMPYVLGYAGFYDAYPWLSFAPFDLALAIGPLVYFYVVRLTSGVLPRSAWIHFVPAALQGLYYSVAFTFPLASKNAWDASFHVPYVVPMETVAVLASMGAYLVLAWRRHRAYQYWLADHVSNREDFRLFWLRNFLAALTVMLIAWAFTSVATAALTLDYFDRFPFYLGLTALVFYLGLEGWRNAERDYPLPAPSEIVPGNSMYGGARAEAPARHDRAFVAGATDETLRTWSREGRDWRGQGATWLAATRAAGWWRDPALTLDRLARHLGTNTSYLSRALNEGLGLNFSEAIGQLRVAEVRRRIATGEADDLLRCALESGFSSKTSFNRVFKAQTGQTPSDYRRMPGVPSADS